MAAPTFEQRQKEEQAKAKEQPSLETQINDLEYLLNKQRQTITYLQEHIKNLERVLLKSNKLNHTLHSLGRQQEEDLESLRKSFTKSEKILDEKPWYVRWFS